MKLAQIKDLIQSCNINFLIGSGLSYPYLSTLGNIEVLLTKLEEEKPEEKIYNLIKASLYKIYCEDVIFRNIDSEIEKYRLEKSEENDNKLLKIEEYSTVLTAYKSLLLSLNEILLYRHNNLLTKQVNLFTTNIDLFLEKALDETSLEFNDGFKGRMLPLYELSNFHKSYSKTSSHYDIISEIPVFNLLKVHGSINWMKQKNDSITLSNNLELVIAVKEELDKISTSDLFLEINSKSAYDSLVEKAKEKIKIAESKEEKLETEKFQLFFNEYDKLLIINPTKKKFERTVIEEQFYELLRLYANSLEKENSLLFVMGFSFADEHLKNITIRAAKSNPTLQVLVFAYSDEEGTKIKNELGRSKNNNIEILTPDRFIQSNSEKNSRDEKKLRKQILNFDNQTVNQEIFEKVINTVRHIDIS